MEMRNRPPNRWRQLMLLLAVLTLPPLVGCEDDPGAPLTEVEQASPTDGEGTPTLSPTATAPEVTPTNLEPTESPETDPPTGTPEETTSPVDTPTPTLPDTGTPPDTTTPPTPTPDGPTPTSVTPRPTDPPTETPDTETPSETPTEPGTPCVDSDSDGSCSEDDCEDDNSNVHPGAEEICNEEDEDCDGSFDEDLATTTYYYDEDGDGYGVEGTTLDKCSKPDDFVEVAGDCLPTNPTSYPGAAETCDGVDNDCDEVVDEEVEGASLWYLDDDEDGFGDVNDVSPVESCSPEEGRASNNEDCDDGDDSINPNATEVCDTADNDCNGEVDDDATDADTWYPDVDGDTYGDNDGEAIIACDQPTDHVSRLGDCDDNDAAVNFENQEICYDGKDNNCDGEEDESGYNSAEFFEPDAKVDLPVVQLSDEGELRVECMLEAWPVDPDGDGPELGIANCSMQFAAGVASVGTWFNSQQEICMNLFPVVQGLDFCTTEGFADLFTWYEIIVRWGPDVDDGGAELVINGEVENYYASESTLPGTPGNPDNGFDVGGTYRGDFLWVAPARVAHFSLWTDTDGDGSLDEGGYWPLTSDATLDSGTSSNGTITSGVIFNDNAYCPDYSATPN